MNILLTGAGGFIGRRLAVRLADDGHDVTRVVRRATSAGQEVIVEDLATFRDWQSILDGIDVVIHLAGRAHILDDRASDPLEAFREINTRATAALAQGAAAAGVKRFIFLSSIGVNGNVTHQRRFSAHDVPNPQSAYAVSKYEAELALKDIAASSGLKTVIIRPPLVHGPGAPGNFEKMIQWLARGVPLPLGAILGNRRSLVGLDNLVDLIVTCLDHPKAVGQTFLVSDGEDISTAELLRRLSRSLHLAPRLFSVPPWMLRFAVRVAGKKEIAQRLLDNLQVDIAHTRETLGWTPPFSVDEGFARIPPPGSESIKAAQ
jgi:nucleoside-diphosphate-sugar epimerase